MILVGARSKLQVGGAGICSAGRMLGSSCASSLGKASRLGQALDVHVVQRVRQHEALPRG